MWVLGSKCLNCGAVTCCSTRAIWAICLTVGSTDPSRRDTWHSSPLLCNGAGRAVCAMPLSVGDWFGDWGGASSERSRAHLEAYNAEDALIPNKAESLQDGKEAGDSSGA